MMMKKCICGKRFKSSSYSQGRTAEQKLQAHWLRCYKNPDSNVKKKTNIKVGDWVEHPTDAWGRTKSLVIELHEDLVMVYCGLSTISNRNGDFRNVLTFNLEDVKKIRR